MVPVSQPHTGIRKDERTKVNEKFETMGSWDEHKPDMNEARSFVVIDSRDPDLAEDNGAVVRIAAVTAPYLYEILVDGKLGELFV